LAYCVHIGAQTSSGANVKKSLLLLVLLAGCGIDQVVDDGAKVVHDTADFVVGVARDSQFWISVGKIAGAVGYGVVTAIVRGRDGAEYFVVDGPDSRTLYRRTAEATVPLVEDRNLTAFRVDDRVHWLSGGEEWTLERDSPQRVR
jgi:hypothetical protein